MNKADNEFFEEYKKLDKILSEIYGENGGVTAYINDMYKNLSVGKAYIKSYDSTLKTLKKVRHIRNTLAHQSANEILSKKEDLEFVKSFHKSILTQKDPLAELQKMLKSHKNKISTQNSSLFYYDKNAKNINNKKKIIGLIIALSALFASAFIVFLLMILSFY